MHKILILYSLNHDPVFIKADCVNIDGDYTEFILNRQIIARYFKCARWEFIYEN